MKKLLSLLLIVLIFQVAVAQKKASQTYLVKYEISPYSAIPGNLKTFRSELITPLDLLSPIEEIQPILQMRFDRQALTKAKDAKRLEYEKTMLSIKDPKFNYVDSEEDFLISLVTSDVTVSNVNPKPITELGLEDELFRYTVSAVLTIKDAKGTSLFEKTLVDPNQEQIVTKAVVFFNPAFKMKADMYKDNPEKLQKATDKMLEKKSHLVLAGIVNQARKELAEAFEIQVVNAAVGLFSVKGKDFEELEKVSDLILETDKKFHAFSKKNRVSKDDLVNAWKASVPIWDKYYNDKNYTIEEKGSHGLLLNCALSCILLRDYENANNYLAKVPDAKKSAQLAKDIERVPVEPGTILTFEEYEKNTRELLVMFREYKDRISLAP